MSVKSDLLAELEANRGAYLSGQALAGKLGVSRNAVWKAMNALKEDGSKILSCPNRGYRLSEESDVVSAEGIAHWLAGAYGDLPVFVFKEIDSTNDEAKRMLAHGFRRAALIVADSQSAGRGRNGRAFYSPGHTGVYMSLLLFPNADLSDAVSVTTAAAVAVVRAIEALTDRKPQIKWVNDVYLDGKKICGILTEAASDLESGTAQSLIVGIGINVSTGDFPAELSGTASSLRPSGVTRNRLIAETASQLLRLAEDLSDKSYLADYRTHSMVLGREITYCRLGETRRATAVGIDDGGGLAVINEDGSEDVLRSGEISVRLN